MRSCPLALLVLASAVLSSPAQNAPAPAQAPPVKPNPFQPQAKQAPGAGPDKVWVNLKTSVYHCPGDRYYGKTKDGQYMTEPDARKAGAHGSRNQTCFK
jgi:hypothetical protein